MIRRLVATAMALALWAACLGSAAQASELSCRDHLLVDYAQPLEKMPGNVLPGQVLPFGPTDLEWRSGRSVVVAGNPISYTLRLPRSVSEDGRVVRPARLGWDLGMRVDSVNRHGRPTGLVRERRWRVGVLRHPERWFEVHAGPGLYRVSVKLRRLGGARLASYRQFIRVLPRRQNLRIGIRGSGSYRPGETVVGRVENRGTLEALLRAGTGLSVERRHDGAWTKVEADEPPSVTFGPSEFLAGGRASGCSFFTIPSDAEPGEYRFSAVVEAGRGKPRSIYRQFAVYR
jgi:hypothetical protein